MCGPSTRSLKNARKLFGAYAPPSRLTSYETTPEPAPSSPANSNITKLLDAQAPGVAGIVVSGAVKSIVTALESVVVVTVVPALPARSPNEIEKTTGPSASPAATVCVARQVFVALSKAALTGSPASVTVGVWSVSLARKLSVTTSPAFASIGTALFEASVTVVSIGLTVSIVRVVAAAVLVLLPAASREVAVRL